MNMLLRSKKIEYFSAEKKISMQSRVTTDEWVTCEKYDGFIESIYFDAPRWMFRVFIVDELDKFMDFIDQSTDNRVDGAIHEEFKLEIKYRKLNPNEDDDDEQKVTFGGISEADWDKCYELSCIIDGEKVEYDPWMLTLFKFPLEIKKIRKESNAMQTAR